MLSKIRPPVLLIPWQQSHERQRQDWRHLRYESFETKDVRKALDELAGKIAKVRRRVTLISLEAFKAQLPIVEIVGRYVTLTRRGAEYLSRCPFHDEKTPSFMVSKAKSFYHCFGCQRHGSAIDFVVAMEGLGFNQAVTRLAEATGLPIPGEVTDWPPAATVGPVTRLGPGMVFRDVNAPWCPEMVAIGPGAFLMGTPENDPDADDREKPQHRVRIAYSMAVGRYPVTFAEYDQFCELTGKKPPKDWGWGRGRRPVTGVSWRDAKAYVEWLREEASEPYRLLSEAEWEFAARAGTTTRYPWGDDITTENANYRPNVGKTTEVGGYFANPWGIHDMHGNVWEWVEDSLNAGSYEEAPSDGSAWTAAGCRDRIVRGGAWDTHSSKLRSAQRESFSTGIAGRMIGFRIARTLPH